MIRHEFTRNQVDFFRDPHCTLSGPLIGGIGCGLHCRSWTLAPLIRFDTDDQWFTFFSTPQLTDLPKIRVTKEGSIWYCPRTGAEPGVGVLHPDMTTISSLAGF